MTASQGLLFSEPLYTETGIWCELSQGIDPQEWANLCRCIGNLSPREFQQVKRKMYPDPDSIWSRLKRIFCFEEWEVINVPLVCLGPEGMGEK